MAEPLDTAIMTCTGSEANDIALRMAEAMTDKRGIISTDSTYHGNTSLVSQLINQMCHLWIWLGQYFRFVSAPDSYRALDPDGSIFASQVAEQISRLEEEGIGFGALLICPIF